MFNFLRKSKKFCISFPDYEVVEPNVVYSKKLSSSSSSSSLERTLMVLSRFQEANSSEILNYVKEKARKMPGIRAAATENKDITLSRLEFNLSNLPEAIIDELAANNPRYVMLLRESLPNVGRKGEHYLQLELGKIDSRVMEERQLMDNKLNLLWYSAKINLQLGMQMLIPGKKLLPRRQINSLLMHGTYISKTLRFSHSEYFPGDVSAVLDNVYSSLKRKEMVDLLPDTSQEILEHRCATSVHDFYCCLLERKIVRPALKVSSPAEISPVPVIAKKKKDDLPN